jgi:hypothetical protein
VSDVLSWDFPSTKTLLAVALILVDRTHVGRKLGEAPSLIRNWRAPAGYEPAPPLARGRQPGLILLPE